MIKVINISNQAFSQDNPRASAEELSKKLTNPVASLISVPFRNITDVGIGSLNGSRNTILQGMEIIK